MFFASSTRSSTTLVLLYLLATNSLSSLFPVPATLTFFSPFTCYLLAIYLLSTFHHQVRNAPLTPGLAACGLQPGTVLYVDGFDGLDYFVRYVPLAALTTG